MSVTLTVRDETTAGQKGEEFTLDFLTEEITVRELIRGRIYQEVKDYNTTTPGLFRGLVEPRGAERELGGYRVRERRQLDWREQFDSAVEAFEKSRILVLVDERQVEDLDETIVVGAETRATFLKLVPLVGG